MARRRQRDRGPVYDAFQIYRVHPILGPAIAAVVIWGGLGLVAPAVLLAISHTVGTGPTGSEATGAANMVSAGSVALDSAAYSRLAQALVWLAPLAPVVLVVLPAACAWAAILWDRGPWKKGSSRGGGPGRSQQRTR